MQSQAAFRNSRFENVQQHIFEYRFTWKIRKNENRKKEGFISLQGQSSSLLSLVVNRLLLSFTITLQPAFRFSCFPAFLINSNSHIHLPVQLLGIAAERAASTEKIRPTRLPTEHRLTLMNQEQRKTGKREIYFSPTVSRLPAFPRRRLCNLPPGFQLFCFPH